MSNIKVVSIETGQNITSKINGNSIPINANVKSGANSRAEILPEGGTGIKSRLSTNNEFLVKNYSVINNATPIVNTLSDLFDLDVSDATEGAVLLYDADRKVWEATTFLNNTKTIINGGFF